MCMKVKTKRKMNVSKSINAVNIVGRRFYMFPLFGNGSFLDELVFVRIAAKLEGKQGSVSESTS